MFIRTIMTQTSFIQTSRVSQTLTLRTLKGPWKMVIRQCTMAGIPGSGAGRGGGGGGSIKDAGGGLGRFGAAQEEGYFYNQEKEKLSKLKKQLKDNPNLRLKDKKDDKEHFDPFMIPARGSTGKDNDGASSKKDKDSKPPVGVEAKEELGPPPTPGFVRPEILCDEGFFTQQARQQIEEQKKKQAKPSLNNPEHRS